MRRLALALSLCGAVAPAQAPTAADVAAIEASDKARDAGHYLAAWRALEPRAFDPSGKPVAGVAFQYRSQFGSMLTNQQPAVSPYPRRPAPAAESGLLDSATVTDALPEIVRRARDTRIVILNENHSDPRDRAFALAVARALWPLGYRTLALETLANDANITTSAAKMRALLSDGFVHRATGTYTQDPVFADFVRQALALGYRPVAYEQTGSAPGIAAREQEQARHLIVRGLRASGAGKLLVYVGFSHAAEAPIPDGAGRPTRWLAARVKAMTGIDPLTIDQVTVADNPAGGEDGALFDVVAPKVDRDAVLLGPAGKPLIVGQYNGAIDLQVVHPRVRRVQGRPDWLLGMGRQPLPIPSKLLPAKGTRLVQAFVAREPADAIPIDQVLVTAGEPAPALMLPPGVPVRYATEDAP